MKKFSGIKIHNNLFLLLWIFIPEKILHAISNQLYKQVYFVTIILVRL